MSFEIVKDYRHSQKMSASKRIYKKLLTCNKIVRFIRTRLLETTNENRLLESPQSGFRKH